MPPLGDVSSHSAAKIGMQLQLHLKLVYGMLQVRTLVTGMILDFPNALQTNIGLVLQNIPRRDLSKSSFLIILSFTLEDGTSTILGSEAA
jgi:hypothetical protein